MDGMSEAEIKVRRQTAYKKRIIGDMRQIREETLISDPPM